VARRTPHSTDGARPLTSRQQQCVALIARGLTNKEMAYELGITERGAASHVSRLLARFGVVNRTSLIAHVIAEQVTESARPDPSTADQDTGTFLPTLERDLDAYAAAPFFVTATLGKEQVLVFVNDSARRLMPGDSVTDVIGVSVDKRYVSASATWWREKSDQVFQTGVARAVRSRPLRWPRGDGSWDEALFSCVLQPLRDFRNRVRGILWICERDADPKPL
jgi:DNA-binding CsgD family transcriptional regulator